MIVNPKRERMPFTIRVANNMRSAREVSVMCIKLQESMIKQNSLSKFHKKNLKFKRSNNSRIKKMKLNL